MWEINGWIEREREREMGGNLQIARTVAKNRPEIEQAINFPLAAVPRSNVFPPRFLPRWWWWCCFRLTHPR